MTAGDVARVAGPRVLPVLRWLLEQAAAIALSFLATQVWPAVRARPVPAAHEEPDSGLQVVIERAVVR